MSQKKQLGVWMGYSTARIMKLDNNAIETTTIKSEYISDLMNEDQRTREASIDCLDQNKNSEYYQKVTTAIRDFDDVLIFGSTTAKNELLNLLNEDRNLKIIELEVRSTGEMSERQEQVFVKDFFLNRTMPYRRAS